MKQIANGTSGMKYCGPTVLGPIHMYFSIIYRHGRVMHDKVMRQFGLTGQLMGYLKYINENPGISQEELSRYAQIDKGAVAKAIKDMVSKEFVDRRQNPGDKRAYCLFPTEKAGRVYRLGEETYMKFERNITKGMSDEEIKTLTVLLGKMTQNIAEMLEGGKI